MSSFQFLETVGVMIIVGVQAYIFYTTKNKIQIFKNIFPSYTNFSVRNVGLKKKIFDFHPSDIFSNLEELITESEPKPVPKQQTSESGIFSLLPTQYEEDDRLYVDVIVLKEKANYITEKIVYSLNTYLIRNRGVASDFHLMKDVVERNAEALESEINQTISLPLYLGLLGTFLGIVVGLFQISGIDFATDPTALDAAITTLLGGVKIAMIASFAGLLLTILNTGYFLKDAKTFVEDKKNDFYTFIQTDLLPLLNQNINSTLYSLQNNLHKFNEEFKSNVTKLSSVMGKNHEALIAQEKILSTLDKIDINEFAKANVKVLRELQVSTEKFSQFNQYLDQMNEMVSNSRIFAQKINEMIARTDNFNTLGLRIIESFEGNKELQLFLQNHYDSLDESHQLIANSVGRVNNTLDESLDKLKVFTQEKIIEVQKLVNKEMDLLENQYPEKWKKLDNLSHLQSLNSNLNDIKMSNASQIGSLTNEIREINRKLNLATSELATIRNNTTSKLGDKITTAFTGIFKKKNKSDEK